MDYDEYNSYPDSLGPVEPVIRSRDPGRVQRRRTQGFDRYLMRWEAWQTQRRVQRRRRWTDEQRLTALENAVSAADLNLAAREIPFVLKLERQKNQFEIILTNEAYGTERGTAYRSGPFELSEVDPNAIGLKVSDFLKKHGIDL